MRFPRIRLLLAVGWKAAPGTMVFTFALIAFTAASAPILSYAMRDLLDGAISGSTRTVLVAVAVIVLSQTIAGVGGRISINIDGDTSEKATMLLYRRMLSLVMGVPGLQHLERSDYLDRVQMLQRDMGSMHSALFAVGRALAAMGGVAVSVVVLATVHPALMLLPVFAVPSFFLTKRSQTILRSAHMVNAEQARLEAHLHDLSTNPAAAKEIHAFGTAEEIDERAGSLWREVGRREIRAQLASLAVTFGGWLVFAIGFVGAIVVAVVRAVHGAGTPGDVLLVLTLASQIRGQVAQAVSGAGEIASALQAVDNYLWLEDYGREHQDRPARPLPVPERLGSGIRLDGVSFTYPGTEQRVLHDVSLDLSAGQTVAIVGENGAGKTSLVKLLLRMYVPTGGRVLVDGTDLADIDPDQWRGRTSAAFQDFAHPEFPFREAVGIGHLPQIPDDTAIVSAVERAGGLDILQRLPHGLETQLGKTHSDGAELSGGQWQKLAIARALMRRQPLLLILDEPTAALDAEAEYALFQRYAEATREVAEGRGSITILVSHRFSTVRMADHIVVLDGGRVVDQGAHEDLLQRGGLYAHLYELQATAYR